MGDPYNVPRTAAELEDIEDAATKMEMPDMPDAKVAEALWNVIAHTGWERVLTAMFRLANEDAMSRFHDNLGEHTEKRRASRRELSFRLTELAEWQRTQPK